MDLQESKSYKVVFFQGQVGADGSSGSVSQILNNLITDREIPIIQIKKNGYELRDLERINQGNVIKGAIAKFRQNNLPHAAAPGIVDRELDLDENEGLIEKNFFLFYKKWELLVWQTNGNGSRVGRLAEYLTEIFGETVLFNPVLQVEAMRRLMNKEFEIKQVRVRVARPTNPDLYNPKQQWSKDILSLMNNSGGMHVDITMRGDGHSKKPEKRYLAKRVKSAIKEMIKSGDVKAAKVVVEDEFGATHPIDLIADRLYSRQDVQMIGRYPSKESMFSALKHAKDECQNDLRDVFGEDNASLN